MKPIIMVERTAPVRFVCTVDGDKVHDGFVVDGDKVHDGFICLFVRRESGNEQ